MSAADLDLLNAGREHARIAAAIDRECNAGSAASDALEARRSAPPDALRYRESDAALGLQQPGRWRDGEFIAADDGLYTMRDSWDLRAKRTARRMIPGYPEDHPKFGQPIPDGEPIGEFMLGHVLLLRATLPRPEVVARVDEIMAAMDAHHAEFDRLMGECGVRAHEDELGRLNESMEPVERVLIETPAATIGGIMEKVRAARWYEGEDKSEPLNADDPMLVSETAHLIAQSVIRDLAAMRDPSV